ncbi:MAG: tyrosine-type recombinase/integrase [Verrucomicrobiota bacterium]
MKTRFILFQRGQTYYCEDTSNGKQISLRTKEKSEVLTLLHSRNEASRQPMLNLQIARTYLAAADPEIGKRTWQVAMDEITRTKTGSTLARHQRAMQDHAFDLIRNFPILETQSALFLKVLETGGVATNVFLRRIHNFALDMAWLPWPILPKKRWPTVSFKEKRAITLEEHQAIVQREQNPEWRSFYEILWQVGGGQTDVANLRAEDIDWKQHVLSYRRKKTGTMCHLSFGEEVAAIVRFRPASGLLFPTLAPKEEKHRAKEFRRRCDGLEIKGVSLHSYRYAWAERARKAGYPERFAQEALGHNSKAVHRAYAKNAQVIVPSLAEFEKRASEGSVEISLPTAACG